MKRLLVLVVLVLASVAVMATTASADYGKGAAYQVALSMNIPSPQGGGIWIWFALYPNSSGGATAADPGHGDYAGADCGHGGAGTASDKGDVTWYYNGDQIVIDGVTYNAFPTDPFNGNFTPFSPTITIPATPGHYMGADDSYTTLPYWVPGGIGFTQLQVAPAR